MSCLIHLIFRASRVLLYSRLRSTFLTKYWAWYETRPSLIPIRSAYLDALHSSRGSPGSIVSAFWSVVRTNPTTVHGTRLCTTLSEGCRGTSRAREFHGGMTRTIYLPTMIIQRTHCI